MKTSQNIKDFNKTPAEYSSFSGTENELVLLSRSISEFNSTASNLEASYKYLQKQVGRLNRELENKNTQLENKLIENEITKNFLNSILESLPTGVFVIDMDSNLLMANRELSNITGIDMNGISRDQFLELLESLQVETNNTACTYNTEYAMPNSGMRYLKVSRSPVIGSGKTPLGLLHIVQDITRTAKIGKQSERDERLKAMGEMAIQVAHEVRNPLGSIELFASILRTELEPKKDLQKMTNHIIDEVKSLDSSISNLLQFTRPQEPVLKEINLNDFILDYIEFMKPLLNKNDIILRYRESTESHIINADRDLLKQVFLNLTLNSFQAMPNGGELSIIVNSSNENSGSDNWVEISFEDNGPGIDQDNLTRIFNPFYTTKDKGTGLGLAIVHNLIESHKGTIEVRSEKRKGTIFQISLPAEKIN